MRVAQVIARAPKRGSSNAAPANSINNSCVGAHYNAGLETLSIFEVLVIRLS